MWALLVALISFQCLYANNNAVLCIPKIEKEILSSFFEVLIRNQLFGYTLFGDKPVTIVAYRTTLPQSIRSLSHMDDFFLFQGEEIWKKYSSEFVMEKYIIKFEKDREGDWGEIVFINKEAFLRVCEQNLALFKQVLGDSITAEKLLKMVSEPDSAFGEVIQNNQVLLGILLGYGTHNSVLFQRREDLIRTIQKGLDLPFFLLHDFDALPKEDFQLLLEYGDGVERQNGTVKNDFSTSMNPVIAEYKSLQKTIQRSCEESDDNELAFVAIPSFVMDRTSDETKNILEKYQQVRKEITQAYSQGNFFEVTLCKLCEK